MYACVHITSMTMSQKFNILLKILVNCKFLSHNIFHKILEFSQHLELTDNIRATQKLFRSETQFLVIKLSYIRKTLGL